jgi:hypothetical protein
MLLKYVLKVCAHYCAVYVIGTKIIICSAAKVKTFFVNTSKRGDFFPSGLVTPSRSGLNVGRTAPQPHFL